MLTVVGDDTLDDLIDAPCRLRSEEASSICPSRTPTEVDARLAALADRNKVVTSLIGMRLPRHHHPDRDPAQHPREPGVVHGVHPVPARDLPGTARGAPELPDHGRRPDRHGDRERVTARRGDGGRRGHDAARRQSKVAGTRSSSTPTAIPRWSRSSRPGPSRSASRWSSATRRLASHEPFGLLLAYPGSSGQVRDHPELVATGAARRAGIAVAADLLALTLLRPPGEWGADVVVGSAQRFGVPLGYGGPHAGFMATSGAPTLPAGGRGGLGGHRGSAGVPPDPPDREQHIRREKATSNICTAQVLLAIIAGAYAVYHGPDGLRTIAERVHRLASLLAAGLLAAGGVTVVNDTWFDTLTVSVPGRAGEVIAAAAERRINLRQVDARQVGVSVDEVTAPAHIDLLFESFGVPARVPTWKTPTPASQGNWRAPRHFSPTRSSPITTARRRCSATSAGCSTATSPSTGR